MPYGYFTQQGYMGKVRDHMTLFASEQDYYDYIEQDSDLSPEASEALGAS